MVLDGLYGGKAQQKLFFLLLRHRFVVFFMSCFNGDLLVFWCFWCSLYVYSVFLMCFFGC